MDMRKIVGYLLGFCLLVAAIGSGFIQFPQWTILLLGGLFTAAYINSKWAIWKDLVWQRETTRPFWVRKFYLQPT